MHMRILSQCVINVTSTRKWVDGPVAANAANKWALNGREDKIKMKESSTHDLGVAYACPHTTLLGL